MQLKSNYIGQEVRRVVFSMKRPSGEFVHVFSIFEKIEEDMQDYDAFPPNCGKEFNDCIKNAPGKEDKIFFTVDRITMTEALYDEPWKDYYSGKEQLKTFTEDYQWATDKNDWEILSSDENDRQELASILPKRYVAKYVRYCVPKALPDDVAIALGNTKLKSQLSELSKRNLGYDLTEHTKYLGGFIFLTYGEIYRRIYFTEKDTCTGIYCRVDYKNRKPLTIIGKRTGNDGNVTGAKQFVLDGSKNIYEMEFGSTFKSLEVSVIDDEGDLIDYWDKLVFLHSIHFDMRIGDREVHVQDEEGNTIKTVQKYIDGGRNVVGDKVVNNGLMDSSPEFSYRKFEEALDFVFYDGDHDNTETNIRKSNDDILRILNGASTRLYICDVFFDKKSLLRFVLPMGSRTIPVKILSGKKELKKDGRREELASAIKAMNKNGIANVECRLLIGDKAELHDRFIVADENVWMLGCSLNKFGSRATTLIRVPKEYRQKLIDRAEEWWKDQALSVDINSVKDDTTTKRRCIFCEWLDKLCGR